MKFLGVIATVLLFTTSSFAANKRIQKAVENLYDIIQRQQTDNYYDYVGVYAFANKELTKLQLAEVKNADALKSAMKACLYNSDESSYEDVKTEINELLRPLGPLTWYSDAPYFAQLKDPSIYDFDGKHDYPSLNPKYKKHDEYGGAGGYLPRCSVVVKTSAGVSFLFHAIDTY